MATQQTRVKLYVPGGWSSAAREHLIDICQSDRFNGVVFLDRQAINDRTLNKANLNIKQYKNGDPLPENYIFLSSTTMEDLPHTTTLCRGS